MEEEVRAVGGQGLFLLRAIHILDTVDAAQDHTHFIKTKVVESFMPGSYGTGYRRPLVQKKLYGLNLKP